MVGISERGSWFDYFCTDERVTPYRMVVYAVSIHPSKIYLAATDLANDLSMTL